MKYLSKFSQMPKHFFGNIFWNMLFSHIPFFVLIAILCLAGDANFKFNDKLITGIKAAVGYLIMLPFIALVNTIYFWFLYVLGNLILKLFLGTFTKKTKIENE